jgi:hypothetical protein
VAYTPIKRHHRPKPTPENHPVARSFKDRNKYNVKAGDSCQAYTGAGKDKFTEYWSPEQYQQVKLARKSQEIK